MCDTFGLVTNVTALTSASLILCRSIGQVDRFEFVGFVTANFANLSPLCFRCQLCWRQAWCRGVGRNIWSRRICHCQLCRICQICHCHLCLRQAADAVTANHEEDSVSNKSHSTHNWHLRSALMQAINVSWYQAVCRETFWQIASSSQNWGGCNPPLISPSVSECGVRL